MIKCDARLPLSGAGHINGAREENQYCEMYLNSGGWELFAMDGDGDKDAHLLQLSQSNLNEPDGIGTIPSDAKIINQYMVYKKSDAYFLKGEGKRFAEILIVIRNEQRTEQRWITVKQSSGGYMLPTTLFNKDPKVSSGSWKIETDRGQSNLSWNDCRSRTIGDGNFVPNNLLRCRLFWKHASSYTFAGNWKCGSGNRLFDNYNVNGNHNGAGALTIDRCFERCLSHPDCRFFNVVAANGISGAGFCAGCATYIRSEANSEMNLAYHGQFSFNFIHMHVLHFFWTLYI